MKEHYIWNYLYFLLHLQLKDRNDLDGTESYVFDKYVKSDISWVPIGRSIAIEEKNKENLQKNENENKNLTQDLKNLEERIAKMEAKI